MAISAINTSAYRNAVSVLHRHVSQEMWQELWPKLPVPPNVSRLTTSRYTRYTWATKATTGAISPGTMPTSPGWFWRK